MKFTFFFLYIAAPKSSLLLFTKIADYRFWSWWSLIGLLIGFDMCTLHLSNCTMVGRMVLKLIAREVSTKWSTLKLQQCRAYPMLCNEKWTILMMESIYCHDTGEGLVFPKVNTKESRIVLLRCHPRPFVNFSIEKARTSWPRTVEAFTYSLLSMASLNLLIGLEVSLTRSVCTLSRLLVMVLRKSKMLFMECSGQWNSVESFRGTPVDIVNNRVGHSGCEKQLYRSVFAEL